MTDLGLVAGLSTMLPAEENQGGMIYRQLGRTGEKVSAIGLGGHHIGRPKDRQLGLQLIHSALDRGINFMDNCWDYNDGDSEVRMGEALAQGGYRKKAFLMTKFDGRTKKAAMQQLEESLQRLKTDHVDLWQFHENIRMEDPDRFFAEGGAREAMDQAKKDGKVRYFGFTGHKDPLVHLRMLEAAQQHKFQFHACQMPLNVMDAHFRSFEKHVLPKLVEQGIGVLGMKPMGDGIILKSGAVKPTECLHYALSLPTSVVITGCESMKILDQAVEAVKTFRPMSESERAALLSRTQQYAMAGKFELFKTTPMFDGTAQNPKWLG